MPITEATRHQLHQRLIEIIGAEEAATLMEHLPPVGWADIATKQDVDHMRAATRQDLDHLRAATRSDLDHLRGDFDHLRADFDHLRADFGRLRDEVHSDIEVLRFGLQGDMATFRADVQEKLNSSMRWTVGTILTSCGLVIAAMSVFAR